LELIVAVFVSFNPAFGEATLVSEFKACGSDAAYVCDYDGHEVRLQIPRLALCRLSLACSQLTSAFNDPETGREIVRLWQRGKVPSQIIDFSPEAVPLWEKLHASGNPIFAEHQQAVHS
jgi:hypothetical protein